MTSMRRRCVASTSERRHVPAGNLAPLPPPPPNILNIAPPPHPQYSKPFYAYVDKLTFMRKRLINDILETQP